MWTTHKDTQWFIADNGKGIRGFPPISYKNENYFIERGIFTVLNRMYLVIDRLVQAWVKVGGVLAAHKKRRNPIPAKKRTLPRCIGQGHNGK